MIAPMVVVIDKPANAGLKITRQVVVFQEDTVLERLMPAFDLALCLRMVGRAEAVAQYRADHALLQAGNNLTLNQQQLLRHMRGWASLPLSALLRESTNAGNTSGCEASHSQCEHSQGRP